MFNAKILPRTQAQCSISLKLAQKSLTIFFTALLQFHLLPPQTACFQQTIKVIKGRSAPGPESSLGLTHVDIATHHLKTSKKGLTQICIIKELAILFTKKMQVSWKVCFGGFVSAIRTEYELLQVATFGLVEHRRHRGTTCRSVQGTQWNCRAQIQRYSTLKARNTKLG